MNFRRISIAFAALLLLAAYLVSCSEPPPGEITGSVRKDGNPYGATLVAVNDKGEEVSQGQAVDGVYTITGLPPGHYTVKCMDFQGNLLGEQEVDVEPDGSHPLHFEL